MSWTEKEKEGFLKWDKDRKSGKLGTPLRFSSGKELRKWLDDNAERHTKIAKESHERFKTHIKDEEVNI